MWAGKAHLHSSIHTVLLVQLLSWDRWSDCRAEMESGKTGDGADSIVLCWSCFAPGKPPLASASVLSICPNGGGKKARRANANPGLLVPPKKVVNSLLFNLFSVRPIKSRPTETVAARRSLTGIPDSSYCRQ